MRKINYNLFRDDFHDIKSQATNFATGLKLLKERIVEDSDYEEIIVLLESSLNKTNQLWQRLRQGIEDQKNKEQITV